ncbi:ribosome biogenesis GTP-binding protein YihA/YsxC [Rickettsiales bacterium LUAb2]
MDNNITPDCDLLFRKECKFLLGVRDFSCIPTFNLTEVAFWGKSNVGKSSLINVLVNRVKLVKVAKTPGKTKEINFFNLNNQLIISDLPGYGFAEVDKATKLQWHNVVLDYLTARVGLKRVYLLIDGRHGLKARDIEIIEFLNKIPRSFMIVLTKTDKINKTELLDLTNKIEQLLQKYAAGYPKVIAVSSKKKFGIDDLRQNIYELVI